MKTQSFIQAFFAFMALSLMAERPSIPANSITVTEDASRTVTVNYTLAGETAIVTAEVFTNGAPVEASKVTRLCGDVNRLVRPGARSFTWAADRELPLESLESARFKVVLTAWSELTPPDYMVVNLAIESGGPWSNVRWYTSPEAFPDGGLANDVYRTQRLVMRRIPAANVTWMMGVLPAEWGQSLQYEAAHWVTLSKDYWMGIYEVTQRQHFYITRSANYKWHNVFGNAPNADTRPAENQSMWMLRGSIDRTAYDWPMHGHEVDPAMSIGWLRAKTGIAFDLPTEAQWEYACRAGTYEGFNSGEISDQWDSKVASTALGELGWYNLNWSDDPACTSNETHVVGLKKPNAWGLYDMHGNVLEMCLDIHDTNRLATAVLDPAGRTRDEMPYNHVQRGGSYSSANIRCRSAAATEYSGPGWPSSNNAKDGPNRGYRLCAPIEVVSTVAGTP